MSETDKQNTITLASDDQFSDDEDCFVSAEQSPAPSIKSLPSSPSLAPAESQVQEFEELEIPIHLEESLLDAPVSRSSIGDKDPREPLKVIDLVVQPESCDAIPEDTPVVRSVFAQEDPREPLTVADIEDASPEEISQVPVDVSISAPVSSAPRLSTVPECDPAVETEAPESTENETSESSPLETNEEKTESLPQESEPQSTEATEDVSKDAEKGVFCTSVVPEPQSDSLTSEYSSELPPLDPPSDIKLGVYTQSSASEDDALPSPVSPRPTRSESGITALSEGSHDRLSQVQLDETQPLRRQRSSISRIYISAKGRMKTTIGKIIHNQEMVVKGEADLYKAQVSSRKA